MVRNLVRRRAEFVRSIQHRLIPAVPVLEEVGCTLLARYAAGESLQAKSYFPIRDGLSFGRRHWQFDDKHCPFGVILFDPNISSVLLY